jgi:peptidoglycan hydrolase CwlO-like protein
VLRRYVHIATFAAIVGVLLAPSARGDLNSRLQSVQGSAGAVRSGISADNAHIRAFQARIDDIQQRLNGLESALAAQEELLAEDKDKLRRSRARLLRLRMLLREGRRVLALQMRAAYESPAPDLVTVFMNAKGFNDLLETVDKLKAINNQDAKVVGNVKQLRNQVATEEKRLTELTHQQQRVTSAVVVQRDAVDETRLDLVRHQAVYIRARNAKSSRLAVLDRIQRKISARIAAQQAAALAAIGTGYSGSFTVPKSIGSFVPHGGSYGFFQAAGTNYTAGVEPILAARLDALGRALHLHLIGLSGYRTPQHSVEVGGFPNDPHTQGRASDTPGVEGVSEATLNQFGLTRPFGGAAEADHIQLLGG